MTNIIILYNIVKVVSFSSSYTNLYARAGSWYVNYTQTLD